MVLIFISLALIPFRLAITLYILATVYATAYYRGGRMPGTLWATGGRLEPRYGVLARKKGLGF